MRILCIGDSNTWGYNPGCGTRIEKRWTKLLAERMPESEIIEEGLNGRTLLSKDPDVKERCGIESLNLLLMSHKPLDYVVIMLGTNELKSVFANEAEDVAKGVEAFIKTIQNPLLWERFCIPQILVISPILIREELIENGDVFGGFDERSVKKSKCLADAYRKVCGEYGVHFLNGADYAEASIIDNIHMDEENHRKLSEAIYEKLRVE